MKQVKQFRFYGTPDDLSKSQNYPEDLSINDLYTGRIFYDYTPITQIGIQSLPGTKFYLNNNSTKTNPIILGYTGTYELNIEGIAEINNLCFETESLLRINKIPGASLIIDIVYGGED